MSGNRSREIIEREVPQMTEGKKVYRMLAVAPVDFPTEVELRVYPHDKETGLALRGSYHYAKHRSWEWVQSSVPLVPHAWAEVEQTLKAGNCAALGLGEYSVDIPDGATGPGIVQ
jgi:hypothetical protein